MAEDNLDLAEKIEKVLTDRASVNSTLMSLKKIEGLRFKILPSSSSPDRGISTRSDGCYILVHIYDDGFSFKSTDMEDHYGIYKHGDIFYLDIFCIPPTSFKKSD